MNDRNFINLVRLAVSEHFLELGILDIPKKNLLAIKASERIHQPPNNCQRKRAFEAIFQMVIAPSVPSSQMIYCAAAVVMLFQELPDSISRLRLYDAAH